MSTLIKRLDEVRATWEELKASLENASTHLACKPGSLALIRMAVGRDGWSEEVTEVFIGRKMTNTVGDSLSR